MSKALALVALVLVAGCAPLSESDPHSICQGAVQGLQDTQGRVFQACVREVWDAQRVEGHKAAQRFRELPRR